MSRPRMTKQRRHELGPCAYGGKPSYKSKAKAKQAILGHRKPHAPLYPYRCPSCGNWHLTSMQPPKPEGGIA